MHCNFPLCCCITSIFLVFWRRTSPSSCLYLVVGLYRMALTTMSEEERLDSDADFKPNLVNSVCYLVEQVGTGSATRITKY